MSKYAVMREEDRLQASALGFGDFFKGIRGSRRKKNLYEALEEGQTRLAKLKVDPADGEAVAALAGAYCRTLGVVTYFRDKKSEALGTQSAVRLFIEQFGRYVAERYFRDKKQGVSHEPSLLAFAVSRDDLSALVDGMTAAGKEAASDLEFSDDSDDMTIEEAVDLLADALAVHESAIPEVDEDGSVPASIQDRGIARAAFIRMRVEDLRATVNKTGDVEERATRMALLDRLADEYAGREQDIAEIVLGLQSGESVASIVTRLLPLSKPPEDLEELAPRLSALRGRYYETGPAQWFCFGETTYGNRTLHLTGEMLGYQVGATLVKDEARLQPTRQRETISIRLRDGVAWAETNAKRAGNLNGLRRVLRRTETAAPLTGMTVPGPVTGDPFSRCDTRTLWMLELLYRELSKDPFIVEDHVMVNFERPRNRTVPSGASSRQNRRATVDAVRLKGMLLIDHPEVCDLILSNRRMVDIEAVLRVKTGGTDPRFYPSMRIRLSWANDHLALTSFPGEAAYNPRMHSRLVNDVRRAATREIDSSYIELPMQRIVGNSGRAETDELGSVLGA